MEVMDTSLERLYKLVYERLGERLPEDIIGKVTVAVSAFLTTRIAILKILTFF